MLNALHTKILLAILALVSALAAFEMQQAEKARQHAESVEKEQARFWENYDRQKQKQPLSWGHAAESLGGFRLRNQPQQKGKQ